MQFSTEYPQARQSYRQRRYACNIFQVRRGIREYPVHGGGKRPFYRSKRAKYFQSSHLPPKLFLPPRILEDC